MAVDALALTQEQAQACDLLLREEARRGELLGGDPGVEARLGRSDSPLEGGNDLTQVGKSRIHCRPRGLRHRVPGRSNFWVSNRTGVGRKTAEIGERSEHGLVLSA